MKPCRECQHLVSEQALSCPNCGAPRPAREQWNGWGFEYQSKAELFGLPLLHVAIKFRPNGMPVVARGVLAIGQFATGVICISQFGLGLVCVSQFAVALAALAQIGVAHSLVAQIGLYWDHGYGQTVYSLGRLLGF